MRTIKTIFSFIESLEVPNEVYEEVGYLDLALQTSADHERLTDYGLFVGNGDAFNYKENGIVVFGDNMVGKTKLVNEFHEREMSEILAENALLMFDPNAKGKFEVYRDPYLGQSYPMFSWVKLKYEYAKYLAENRGVPLKAIIHLTDSSEEGFVQPNIDVILGYLSKAGTLHTPQEGIIPPILHGVEFLEYSKGYENDFRNSKHLEKAFQNVRGNLDHLLS